MTAPGDVVAGRYEITQVLGDAVFVAIDRALDHTVVLKRVHADADGRARLARLRHLAHGSLVRVHDVVWRGDEAMVTMDLADGAALSARLAAGPLAPAPARAVADAIDAAIDALHAAGLSHGALSADDVIVDDAAAPPRVVVVGLGAALGDAGRAGRRLDLDAARAIARSLGVAPARRGVGPRAIVAIVACLCGLALAGWWFVRPPARAPARPAHVGPTGPIASRWHIGGAGDQSIHVTARTPDGGTVVVGGGASGARIGRVTVGEAPGGPVGFVAVFDASGALRWTRHVAARLRASALDVRTDGDAIIALASLEGDGTLFDGARADGGGTCVVAAFDAATGAVRWQATVTSTLRIHARRLLPGPDGGVVVAGQFLGRLDDGTDATLTGAIPLVVAFDARGERRWVSALTSLAGAVVRDAVADDERVWIVALAVDVTTPAPGVRVTPAGGVDGVIVALDRATGVARRAFVVGGPGDDDVRALAAAPSGALIVGGTTTAEALRADPASTTRHAPRAFVAAYDAASGAPAWAHYADSGRVGQVRHLHADGDGVIALGIAREWIELVPGTRTATSGDSVDAFAIVLGPDGALRGARRFGGDREERTRHVHADGDAVTVAFSFAERSEVDGVELTSDGGFDATAMVVSRAWLAGAP